MLRLTEIRLPLDHPPEAIAKAAAARLRLSPEELISCTVARRAHDARKKHAILLVYSLDVEVKESQTKPPPRFTEATLLGTMETAGKLVDDAGMLQQVAGRPAGGEEPVEVGAAFGRGALDEAEPVGREDRNRRPAGAPIRSCRSRART